METVAETPQASTVKRYQPKTHCNKSEKAAIQALIVGNAEHGVSLKQDRELAAIASQILGKKITHFVTSGHRNKLGIKPWRGSVKKVARVKRAYVKSADKNNAQVVWLLKKIAINTIAISTINRTLIAIANKLHVNTKF